ncbi:AAA family ATPase [Leisingera thetidis]|uniref:AAA family ATPase n=1 Tax=Leisingera thetidis TaxID=2930199 RepID=UPI0021F7EC47|nr:ATP-binding protein [Leisingera thetidis]
MSIGDQQTLSMVATKLAGSHEPFDVSIPSVTEGVLPCAIIYGPNASGKSNLISAFERMRSLILTSHSPRKLNAKIPHQPFLLGGGWSDCPTTFDVSFTLNGTRYDYGFSHDAERIHSEYLDAFPEGRRRKLFSRSGDEIDFGATFKGAKKTISELTRPDALFLTVAAQHNHDELAGAAQFFSSSYLSTQLSFADKFVTSSLEQGEVDERAIKFLNLIGTGIIGYKTRRADLTPKKRTILNDIVRVMQKHSDDEEELPEEDIFPTDMKEVSLQLEHRSDNGEAIYFNIDQESLGTRRLLELLNHIFKTLDEGRVAFIDELDASLHTFAVRSIIELFTNRKINKKNAQLISTTHDTNILSTDHLRRDEIWFVEKSHGGASEYFPLSEFSVRRDEILEKQYLDGRYGAVPAKFSYRHFLKDDPASEI